MTSTRRLVATSLLLAVACNPQAGRTTQPPPQSPAQPAPADPPPQAKGSQSAAITSIEFVRAFPIPDNPQRIAQAVMMDGRRIAVNMLVLPTAKPKKKPAKPPQGAKLTWAGREFVFVNGVFEFANPLGNGMVYFWDPPTELVEMWNSICPEAKFEKSHGFHGDGWYWGGVGNFGFHRFASQPPPIESKTCPLKRPKRVVTPPPPPKHACKSDPECSRTQRCEIPEGTSEGVCRAKTSPTQAT